jgi:ABC-2 type transport system permease protein
MINSFRSETLKLRSLRGTWVGAGMAGALAAVIGYAQVQSALSEHRPVPRLAQIALAPVQALWFVVVTVAIVASAGEFQRRTIRTTMLLTPRRGELLLSKSMAAAAFGAITVAGGMVLATAAGLIGAAASGTSVGLGGIVDVGHIAAAVALGAMWSVFATALGVLTRSTAVAIAAVLLWRFVGEGLLPVVLSPHGEAVTRWMPSGAANALIGGAGLPTVTAALALAGFVGVVCALAGTLLTVQDPV